MESIQVGTIVLLTADTATVDVVPLFCYSLAGLLSHTDAAVGGDGRNQSAQEWWWYVKADSLAQLVSCL